MSEDNNGENYNMKTFLIKDKNTEINLLYLFYEKIGDEKIFKGTYLWLFTYPCYRIFQEMKLFSLQNYTKDFYFPKLKEIQQIIKYRNKYYCTACYYAYQ